MTTVHDWTREQRGDRAMDVNSGWRGWVGREGDREKEEEEGGEGSLTGEVISSWCHPTSFTFRTVPNGSAS